MRLRYYQDDAIQAVMAALAEHRRALLVLATGLGKTVVFARMTARYVKAGKRVLILAHRIELIRQAAQKIAADSGIRAAFEVGGESSGLTPDLFDNVTIGPDGLPMVVVASTMSMVRRTSRYAADHFDLVIVDEAHHATANTYRNILDYFAQAEQLGVTATPKRADKHDPLTVFKTVAFEVRIFQAIKSGWLVPILSKVEVIEGLDLSSVRLTAGDYNQGDLEAEMSRDEVLVQCAEKIAKHGVHRQTIVFTVTVAHAHAMVPVLYEALCDQCRELGLPKPDPGVVRALDGTSDDLERSEVVQGFHSGKVQFLLNCALYTEGFDAPATAMVALARPTRSIVLLEQMVGRGTRPLPNTVDLAPDRDDWASRYLRIHRSDKKNLLVLDLAGSFGKKKPRKVIDVVAAESPDAVRNLAAMKVERGEFSDVLQALEVSKQEIEEMERRRREAEAKAKKEAEERAAEAQRQREAAEAAMAEAQAKYERSLTPASIWSGARAGLQPLHSPLQKLRQDGAGGALTASELEATPKQIEILKSFRVPIEPGLKRGDASELIAGLYRRRRDHLASFEQCTTLAGAGLEMDYVWKLGFTAAAALCSELRRNGGRRPRDWERRKLPIRATAR